MAKDLSDFRKSYLKGSLNEKNLPQNPIQLFSEWFNYIDSNKKELETNAMSLSTVNDSNFPHTRIVLLKKFSNEGFIFFTNYNSRKGKSIDKNPSVCLSFFWPSTEQQVIINGNAFKLSKIDSDSYFNSRPIGSQLGAVVSNQSEIIKSRKFLEDKMSKLKLDKSIVKRPEHWGGYNVIPSSIEFWQGRDNRLHDRILYKKDNNIWNHVRLSP
jgi:pyridoxamine 5'-phosphate oxidase|tara:strand:+ start:8562 stop:9200 length:639 start_codon:yes stop_codon:yes gene_type:complete